MTSRKFHSAVSILLGILVLLSLQGFAQRKKKSSSNLSQPQGIKLLEAEFYFTEGEKYFILEDYAKALLKYQQALDINPDNATIHYKIADALARGNRQEDLVRASVSIENALKLEKNNKYFYQLAASIYSSLTRFDKAAQMYETMIREVKGTDDALYELAAVYQYANKPEDAIKVYNRAESIFGINEISSIQKQRLYLELGKLKEAIVEGEKLIAAFPDEERYVMGFAEVLSQKGHRDLGISYLEKFVAENPKAGNAKMLLAGLYRDNNQELKAREILLTVFNNPDIELNSKIIVLGTYSTELNQNKAKNLNDTEKEAFAINLFESLQKDYAENSSVHILGGDLYLSAGKTREAQKQYLKAIELGDVNFEVWQNLLYIEIQLEQFDNVIKHSEQGLELFPNQSMLYYFSGYGYVRKHRVSEGISALEQAKKLSSTNTAFISEVNSLLGDAYHSVKDYEKSDNAYEEALTYNPNNEMVLNNYSYYLALRKSNLEKAEKMSSLLIKNNPDNPSFLDTHAWVLYMRQKYKEAKKVMEKAISTGHANATHFEHYGDILYQLGDVNAAVQQWEKARGLNANSETLNKKIANRKIYE